MGLPASPPHQHLMLSQNRLERRKVDGGHSKAPILVIVIVATTAGILTCVSHRCKVRLHVLVEEVDVRLEERHVLLVRAIIPIEKYVRTQVIVRKQGGATGNLFVCVAG